MEKKPSGLVLPLKVLSLTAKGSAACLIIRREAMPLVRRSLESVTYIPQSEVMVIRQYVDNIRSFDPVLADEVIQLVAKFHPNL